MFAKCCLPSLSHRVRAWGKTQGWFCLGLFCGITTGDGDYVCWDISWYTEGNSRGIFPAAPLYYTRLGKAAVVLPFAARCSLLHFLFYTILSSVSPAQLFFVSVEDLALLAVRAVQILDFGLDLHRYLFCPDFINAWEEFINKCLLPCREVIWWLPQRDWWLDKALKLKDPGRTCNHPSPSPSLTCSYQGWTRALEIRQLMLVAMEQPRPKAGLASGRGWALWPCRCWLCSHQGCATCVHGWLLARSLGVGCSFFSIESCMNEQQWIVNYCVSEMWATLKLFRAFLGGGIPVKSHPCGGH